MSIWELYKKPSNFEGAQVPGLNARYYTGREASDIPAINSSTYMGWMGFYYFLGLSTYLYCTRNGMRSQRMFSTIIITAVPFLVLCHLKGDDNLTGLPHNFSLQERLEFYPVTRRALERAIEDVEKNN